MPSDDTPNITEVPMNKPSSPALSAVPNAQPCETTCAAPAETVETPVPGQGPDRRQSVVDRRVRVERRTKTAEESGYTGPERRVAERRVDSGLERRRGPGR